MLCHSVFTDRKSLPGFQSRQKNEGHIFNLLPVIFSCVITCREGGSESTGHVKELELAPVFDLICEGITLLLKRHLLSVGLCSLGNK